ncbi:macrophage mannose receptor 1-like [Silurus meridionalis]|uniref:macrophage mannose receptor 1-like n=1 Tax=Silurus meridionalis TaxID=175797 RepID=UPI001EE9D506|nr:macrophage mannose receptor 1-like [Silurus meridionalis]
MKSFSAAMKSFLFLFGFFTGIVSIFPPGSRKYYLIQQGKTWSDAQVYCRATHTDLAIIKNTDDVVQFQDEVQKQKFSSNAWIGLSVDVSSWHWSYGNYPLGIFTDWAGGEPNNWGGHEECGVINTNAWNDKPCTSMFAYMCFDNSKTGTDQIIYFSNITTWVEAQSFCRQYYTDLATITTTAENTFIKRLVTGFTWFGLVRDSWKWIDQTNFSTISWRSGQPDNFNLMNEDCGFINNGQVADAACSLVMPFFCYSEITKRQQIVSVKVQSNQDVNVPEVKEAILKQIMQKMKERIMSENILVRWREKPGGEVFHKEKGNQRTMENVNRGTCDI